MTFERSDKKVLLKALNLLVEKENDTIDHTILFKKIKHIGLCGGMS